MKLEEYLGSGRLFYTIDVKQAAQSGYEPEEYMRFAKGRYLNIHICDYIKTKNNSILPALPFEGLMDYERIKEELSVSDYKGAVILEVYQNNYRGYEHLLDTYNAMTSAFSI